MNITTKRIKNSRRQEFNLAPLSSIDKAHPYFWSFMLFKILS